jgi:hypothetical protein
MPRRILPRIWSFTGRIKNGRVEQSCTVEEGWRKGKSFGFLGSTSRVPWSDLRGWGVNSTLARANTPSPTRRQQHQHQHKTENKHHHNDDFPPCTLLHNPNTHRRRRYSRTNYAKLQSSINQQSHCISRLKLPGCKVFHG